MRVTHHKKPGGAFAVDFGRDVSQNSIEPSAPPLPMSSSSMQGIESEMVSISKKLEFVKDSSGKDLVVETLEEEFRRTY